MPVRDTGQRKIHGGGYDKNGKRQVLNADKMSIESSKEYKNGVCADSNPNEKNKSYDKVITTVLTTLQSKSVVRGFDDLSFKKSSSG